MRNKAMAALIIIMSLSMAACATDPGKFEAKLPPTPPPRYDLKIPKPTAGSLFVAAKSDFFSDLRARHVGDVIVVEIVENSKAYKKNDTKAERKTNYEIGVANFLGAEDTVLGENPDKLITANFNNKSDAKAQLTKQDTMTSSIGCTVIEVLQNGNMIVKGSRELQVNGETQYIVLQGTIRPQDVTTDNTVYSTQLADATIHYTGRGVLSDKQTPGWLGRLLDHIWPF